MVKGSRTVMIIQVIEKTNEFMRLPIMALMISLTAIMTFEVIMRYFFRSPTMFSKEASLIIQVGLGTLGAGYLLKHDDHVVVDFVYQSVGKKIQRYMRLASSTLGVLYSGCIVLLSIPMVRASFLTSERTLDLAVLLWPIKTLFLIGIFLFGLEFIAKVYKNLIGEVE